MEPKSKILTIDRSSDSRTLLIIQTCEARADIGRNFGAYRLNTRRSYCVRIMECDNRQPPGLRVLEVVSLLREALVFNGLSIGNARMRDSDSEARHWDGPEPRTRSSVACVPLAVV